MGEEEHIDRHFLCGALDVEHLRDLQVEAARHPRGLPHLSAASGMVWQGDEVIVIADDEHHLGIFDVVTHAAGRLLRLLPGDLPVDVATRKQLKPDSEALLRLPPHPSWPEGALLAMGSGSRPNRQTGLLLPLDALKTASGIVERDLAPLYAPLHAHFADLNIEGAFVSGEEFVLIHRGSTKPGAASASIAFALAAVLRWLGSAPGETAPSPLRVTRHVLPEVAGVPLSFTDGAALQDGDWLFSAVAEDTRDSYADGICVGAAVGIMHNDGTLHRLWMLPGAPKVEGIAARIVDGAIVVLMTTDADDPAQAGKLLRAVLPYPLASDRASRGRAD